MASPDDRAGARCLVAAVERRESEVAVRRSVSAVSVRRSASVVVPVSYTHLTLPTNREV